MLHNSLSPKLTHSFSSTSTSYSHRLTLPRPITSAKIDDAYADQFLQNNSVADFMRFKRDYRSQLQTAVVFYRKKFPWSLLLPFVRVDLVSTIHIADKE